MQPSAVECAEHTGVPRWEEPAVEERGGPQLVAVAGVPGYELKSYEEVTRLASAMQLMHAECVHAVMQATWEGDGDEEDRFQRIAVVFKQESEDIKNFFFQWSPGWDE